MISKENQVACITIQANKNQQSSLYEDNRIQYNTSSIIIHIYHLGKNSPIARSIFKSTYCSPQITFLARGYYKSVVIVSENFISNLELCSLNLSFSRSTHAHNIARLRIYDTFSRDEPPKKKAKKKLHRVFSLSQLRAQREIPQDRTRSRACCSSINESIHRRLCTKKKNKGNKRAA